MLESAVNIDIEELLDQSVIQDGEKSSESGDFNNIHIIKSLINTTDIEELRDMTDIENGTAIEDVNVFNVMIVLEKIKKIFLERREFVQKRVNNLDYQIEQKQLSLAFVVDINNFKELKESIDKMVIERKKLLLEKQLMKKLDINNQFTYGMIGMGIQTFKNLTQGLDWEEMKL